MPVLTNLLVTQCIDGIPLSCTFYQYLIECLTFMVNKLKQRNLNFWVMSIEYSIICLLLLRIWLHSFKLLSGDSQLNSLKNVTPEAERAVSLLSNVAANATADRINPSLVKSLQK